MNPFRIYRRIIVLRKEIANKEEELKRRYQDIGVSQGQLDRMVEKENKPLKAEEEMLNFRLQFLIQIYTIAVALIGTLLGSLLGVIIKNCNSS